MVTRTHLSITLYVYCLSRHSLLMLHVVKNNGFRWLGWLWNGDGWWWQNVLYFLAWPLVGAQDYVTTDSTQRHITLGRTPLYEGSARCRDIYTYNTQHLQETDIHVPGGIRIRNPTKRAAADHSIYNFYIRSNRRLHKLREEFMPSNSNVRHPRCVLYNSRS